MKVLLSMSLALFFMWEMSAVLALQISSCWLNANRNNTFNCSAGDVIKVDQPTDRCEFGMFPAMATGGQPMQYVSCQTKEGAKQFFCLDTQTLKPGRWKTDGVNTYTCEMPGTSH